jgi:hypothetical protein
MGASMNSLGELVASSSKARKQLLQALNPEDRSIAKALRPILDEFDELSKEQRAQLYEQMQITFDAIDQVEAHAAQQIAQKNSELPKLPNDDDDWAEMQRMVDREMARQQARKPTVSPVRSPASFEPSATSPASPASPARSPARNARDLHQKPMQKPFVSPPRSLFRTPTGSPVRNSTLSPRSSPRYSSPARDSHRKPTRNTPVFSARSPARTPPRGSPRSLPSWRAPARSPIKPCLFVKNLYATFHRPNEEEYAPQGQKQRAFPGLTHRFSVETSVSAPTKASISAPSAPSPRPLKRFLQRSTAKISSWVR